MYVCTATGLIGMYVDRKIESLNIIFRVLLYNCQ